jgi:hypothetical protein
LGDLDVWAHLAVEAGDCEAAPQAMRLVSSSADLVVEVEGQLIPQGSGYTWLVGSLASPLQPDTKYALQLMLSNPGEDACACLNSPDYEVQWTTVSTFTTAAGPDEEPPVFLGVSSFEAGQRFDTEGPCGSPTGVELIPEFVPPAAADLRYNVYVDGVLTSRYVRNLMPAQTVSALLCGVSGGLHNQTVVSAGSRIEIRVVDMAGNESAANEPVLIADELCSSGTPSIPPEDAGTMPSNPDVVEPNTDMDTTEPGTGSSSGTNGEPVQMPVDTTRSGGCTLSSSIPSVGLGAQTAAWPLFLALLVLRRRTQRPS